MVQPKKKSRSSKGSKKKIEDSIIEIKEKESKNLNDHPIECGNYLIVRYRDNSHRLARVRRNLSYLSSHL